MRILIIEDEPISAMLMEQVLIEAGHQVVGPVRDTLGAVACLNGSVPDLALVDINLPGEEKGTDLARYLSRRWKVPSLFVSAQTLEARANTDAALGLLVKPYLPERLVEAVGVIAAMRSGQSPDRLPPGLELF